MFMVSKLADATLGIYNKSRISFLEGDRDVVTKDRICVGVVDIMDGLDRDIVVEVFPKSITTSGMLLLYCLWTYYDSFDLTFQGQDYSVKVTTFIFPKYHTLSNLKSSKACTTFSIFGDVIKEANETFKIIFVAQTPDIFENGENSVTAYIRNDDCKF